MINLLMNEKYQKHWIFKQTIGLNCGNTNDSNYLHGFSTLPQQNIPYIKKGAAFTDPLRIVTEVGLIVDHLRRHPIACKEKTLHCVC